MVLNVFPLADRPARRGRPGAKGRFRLYWFSQTIGRERGLEDVIAAMGWLPDLPMELHLRGCGSQGIAAVLESAARAAGVPWARIVSHDPAPSGEMVRLAADHTTSGWRWRRGSTTNADIALVEQGVHLPARGRPVLASATTAQSALAATLGPPRRASDRATPARWPSVLRRWLEQPDALATARPHRLALGTTRYNWDAEQQKFSGVVRTALGDGTSAWIALGRARVMKRVLIVSPSFPPISAADLHRVRTSLPFYREFGWQPFVLAVGADAHGGCRSRSYSRRCPVTSR